MKLNLLTLAGASLLLAATSQPLLGQDNAGQDRPRRQRGEGFDPAQMREQMEQRMRERMEVTNDDEWKVIYERIQKIMTARAAAGGGMGGAFFGRGPGGPGGPGGGDAADGQRRRGGSPEADELRAALEAKASPDEIKAKLAKLREARKANEAKLEKAQEELRGLLNLRQEAMAVTLGLLK